MEAQPIYDAMARESLTAEDGKLVAVLKADHDAIREFVSKSTGKSADNMYNYLALVQDDPIVQVVSMTRKVYVEHYIQSDPDLAKLPMLLATALFKVGGRKNDPASFVEVEKGQFTFRNTTDLYLYPNTPVVMKINRREVKEWLECSAGQFDQIGPTSSKPQSLINWDGFRIYNLDVIDGVNCQIDVTQPARYDGECQTIHPQAEHIKYPTLNGRPVGPQTTFLVATNNYRAYGDRFAGAGEGHTALVLPGGNRPVPTVWMGAQSKKDGATHPAVDDNQRLAPTHSNTPLDTRLETSPGDRIVAFIKEKAQYPMCQMTIDDIGFATYQLDLNK